MRILILGLLLCSIACRPAQARPESSANASSAKPAASTLPAGPIERQPYRIEAHLTVDPETRIDSARKHSILTEWQTLVGRFVGSPWDLKIHPKASLLAGQGIESLTPELCSGLGGEFDKFWMIRIGSSPAAGGLVVTGREYDVATRRLGPIQSKSAIVTEDLPRALLGFSVDLFNPIALISGEEGGKALLTVRGASLTPASPIGAVASPGTIFVPLRLTTARDGKPLILRIPYTYLKVESITGSVARCIFVKGISDPLSKRWPRPYTFAAIGIKAGDSPLRLRFVTTRDKLEVPASGYIVTIRDAPDGLPREVGATDRSGRISIRPQSARGLVMVRLLAGSVEPLFDSPMMPGESTDERTIPVHLLPLAVALETQLDSLRDQVVDLVALRARLEARMKARLEGEDWEGLDATIKEFRGLEPRQTLADRLKALNDGAIRQQAETKSPVLTRTAQARVDELQALVDRYLDDDEVNAYAEALTRGKAEAVEQAQGKSKTPARRATGKAKSNAPPPIPESKAAPTKAKIEVKTKEAPKARDASNAPAPPKPESAPKAKAPPPKSGVPF